jgi:hypothetical protein
MTTLDEPRPAGAPVVKRTAIGERTRVALVSYKQRDRKDEHGNLMLKEGSTTKAKQELVVTAIAMPGHTAPAAIGGKSEVPSPGDTVRLILNGGAFADWITAKDALPATALAKAAQFETGDVIEMVTDRAQAYNGRNSKVGPELTTQAQVDAEPRGHTVGIYGTLTIRRSTPADAQWAKIADDAYHASTSTPIAADDEDAPF